MKQTPRPNPALALTRAPALALVLAVAVTLRLTLAKVTGWLRWSASQPEPLIGKCDEDVLVVPPMLEAYATLLCNMSLHAGGREPAQVRV